MLETVTTISPTQLGKIKNANLTNKEKLLYLFKKPPTKVLPEDMEILATLEILKEDLDYVHNCLDHITDPVLIDSYIYQILSINMKYQFFLQLCKERGLMADIV